MVKIFSIGFVLAIIVSLGYFLFFPASTTVVRTVDLKKTSELEMLNPVVLSNINKHFIINFQPLREKFLEIDEKYPSKNYVYFTYLNNAAWVGLNERELITAASLIKVPLAMAYLKAVEERKFSGNELYTLSQEDLNDGFGELYKVGAGEQLTANQLVEIMLQNSDNTASYALMSLFSRIGIDNPFEDVYKAMGWEDTALIGETTTYGEIHLKLLSNMFLSLYNATYVNAEHSALILSNLAKTFFNDQIVAGVPDGIIISHKTGVNEENQTYSDCGIVYAPNRSYLLCAASVGVSKKEAANFIAEISEVTYDYVISN